MSGVVLLICFNLIGVKFILELLLVVLEIRDGIFFLLGILNFF